MPRNKDNTTKALYRKTSGNRGGVTPGNESKAAASWDDMWAARDTKLKEIDDIPRTKSLRPSPYGEFPPGMSEALKDRIRRARAGHNERD